MPWSGSNTGTTRENIKGQMLRGAVAGMVGTVFMTIPILAARRLGFFHTPPPVEISANLARRTPLLPERSNPLFPVAWLGAHFAYGAASGIGYTLLRRYLPVPTAWAGLLFGLGVWAISYLGYVPALHLYPEPDDDSRPRQVVMILAHAVFGVSVAETNRRLAGHRWRAARR